MKKSSFPYASLILFLLQISFFVWQMGMANIGLGFHLHEDYAFEWNRFLMNPRNEWPTLISSAFFHGGWGHLIGNLLFFAVFAPVVELSLGSIPFFVIYVAAAVSGALAQAYFSPIGSLLGSSGAISGLMGTVFVMYPMKMPQGLFKRYFPWISRIPVFVYVGAWFLWNLRMGFKSIMPPPLDDFSHQVAYLDHIFGFAIGAFLGFAFSLYQRLRFREE